MVFFFAKDAIELQLETRLNRATGAYTVVRRRSDGVVFTDDVMGEEPCRLLLRSIEEGLEADGWRRSRPPEVLPDC
jgi:hypothetical protein